jgi:starch-binding outer membrane protein SusE/F
MKKITYFLAILAVFVFWTSCEKDDEKITLDLSQSVAPVLGDLSHIVLLEDNATDTLTISWSKAEYGSLDLPSVTYRLSLLQADTVNFLLTETENLFHRMTVNALNSRLLSLGFMPEVSVPVQFKVSSFVSVEDNGTMLQSEVITVTVTPYEAETEPEVTVLWVPGAYQGWSPATAPNVYSTTGDDIYKGYVHFPEGTTSLEFKFTGQPNWDGPNYGFGGEGVLDTDPGAGNLTIPETGTYYFTVNTDALTWGYQVRNYALIGTFNNWADDEPITWDEDNKVFTITMDFVVDDRFKWRANGSWAINYGIKSPDDGTLVQDGADITITEAGNYTIILDLYEVVPRYELIKN